MQSIAEVTRQLVKKQEIQFYRKHRRRSQQLYTQGSEAVAKALDRRCPWCSRLLVPEIRQVNIGRGPELQAVFPDRCGCPAEASGLAEEAERRERAQEAFERRQWADTLRSAGLVGWLASATFDNYLGREDWRGAGQCKAAVQDYAAALISGQLEDRPWLILHGTYGTGKSHLAASVVREALTYGWRRCYFRVWPHYLKRLQASWERREGEERTSDVVSELQSGHLVAIDDLDKKQPSKSGWAEDELFTVLNQRYNERAPTILTFNHGPDDRDSKAPGRLALEQYVGRAVLDRIMGSAFDVIAFDGPSFRSHVRWR